MATSSEVFSVHNNVSAFMVAGGLSMLLGFSSYFMSYEVTDGNRLGVGQEAQFQMRKKVALAVMIISAFFYVAGIVLLALGISLFRDERSTIALTVAGIIEQQQEMATDSQLNEPAIVSGLAAALVLLGSIQSIRNFNKTQDWGWLGSTIFTTGWILFAIAAATNNNSLTSVRTDRLVWSLVGTTLIVGSTFIIPWALHHRYVTSPAFPLMAFGVLAFGVSTSWAIPPPSETTT